MKRKRPRRAAQFASKKQKISAQPNERPSHALLQKYYPEVVTLRQYLASRLSKKRRRRLQQYGRDATSEHDMQVVTLLDTTLIGSFKHIQIEDSSFVDDDLVLFTQQILECEAAPSLTPGKFKQPEIIDFVVWMLFRKQNSSIRPQHLLCQNYQRYVNPNDDGPGPEIVPAIPGVYSNGAHENVDTLKGHPWCALPDLLGQGAERVLGDMLIDCGLFVPVGNSSNLVQICGVPMSDLEVLSTYEMCEVATHAACRDPALLSTLHEKGKRRGLTDIRFVRHRMLYARPSLNAKGAVRFGLHQIHVLNRYREVEDVVETHHIMKYIFPLQFGLHNVLKSEVNPKDTAQAFKDYTTREQEIAKTDRRCKQRRAMATGDIDKHLPALPKRLRGAVACIVQRLRKRHARCAYNVLLDYYCTRRAPSDGDDGQSLRHACTVNEVSSFCRAVVTKVFPKDFWSARDAAEHNARVLMANVDRFVRLRRYETFSLHDVLQNMRLDIDWLAPLKQASNGGISASDFAKRKELMAELLYYLFDSFLVPLIRNNFHVTESNAQRNQLFYFRHDVWRDLSKPAMDSLKLNMLEECRHRSLTATGTKRQLGVSHVRLVPKEIGMRPIINLRRRVQKVQHGQVVLGRSINSILTPAFSVLNFEKSRTRHNLGSALFSVDDIYPRLQTYRQTLEHQGLLGKPLYFAKVDVQACFDNIPQKNLMELTKRIIDDNEYQISKYSRAKLLGSHNKEMPGFGAKPSWKFLTKASPVGKGFDFQEELGNDIAEGRRRAVYINGLSAKRESRRALLSLLEEHVGANLIQIGKRLYRQKEGIPQGSIVSSLLCSFFYADMERQTLGFVNDGRSVLLRLIDDFLLISTDQTVAEKFMRTMHAGVPEYGVQVKLEKSRANFEIQIEGRAVPMLTASDFPYCGSAIDTTTLDLSKDKERRRKTNVADSVAVEYSKLPGQTFYRKLLNALKLQMRAMLLSTSYNSVTTVLSNLYHAFVEVAQKSYHYIKSLPSGRQPSGRLVIRAVDDMIKLACVLMKRQKRTNKEVIAYECCVTGTQARCLLSSAAAPYSGLTSLSAVQQRLRSRHHPVVEPQ